MWPVGVEDVVGVDGVKQHDPYEQPVVAVEFHTRLNMRQTIGASLQKILKSHSIPISTKIRLMKKLLWPVATYGCEAGHSERRKKHVLTLLR